MDAKLKDHLPQLTLQSLSKLDRGKLSKQFTRAIGRVMQNISEFPIRGDKPETRKISIKLSLTPVVTFRKTGVETAYGHSEASIPEITGLVVSCEIDDKCPIYRTDDVNFLIDVTNGNITDARFNPENNVNPAQLQIDFDDDDEGDPANDPN